MRTEGSGVIDEDVVKTAREVSSHSTGTPNSSNPRGWEKVVFTFARAIFKVAPTSSPVPSFHRGRRLGWWVDYPDADLNLSYRLQQMTSMKVDPNGRIINLVDEDLAQHPWIYIVEPGGLAFNDLVASGRVQAPIVIGRDHLDCGSVASPYRETEGMLDGSDAIADWPLLNAMVNVASGAAWVSIHHGGGVGMGRSIHAGQVTVADGTDLAAQKLERVLTNDPGMGIVRHVDAGYEEAATVATERNVPIPMRER